MYKDYYYGGTGAYTCSPVIRGLQQSRSACFKSPGKQQRTRSHELVHCSPLGESQADVGMAKDPALDEPKLRDNKVA